MNKIPLYQHPFVDIFKAFKLLEWKNSEKSGDVTDTIDKTIGKKLPKSKSPLKSLGLIGHYIYIEAFTKSNRPFSLHFDYIIDDKQFTRISLSNVFKAAKVVNTTNLQLPLQFPENWSILCLRVVDLLDQHKLFLPGSKKDVAMRSMQLCGNLTVKGVYTSDVQYSIRTLPKEMAFRLPKDVEWYSVYSWVDVPPAEKENDAQVVVNSKVKSKTMKETKGKTIQVVEQSASLASPLEEDKDYSNLQVSERIEEEIPEVPQENLKSDTREEEKAPVQEVQGVFRIRPNPVLSLKKLLGTTHKSCPTIEFNKNVKYSDEVAFVCGNTLVHMNCESSVQRFTPFVQSPAISKLKMSSTFFMTLDDKNTATVWSNRQESTPTATFTPPFLSISAVAISQSGKSLLFAGKDQYKREMLVAYNVENVLDGRVEIEARQLSDYEVRDAEWSGEKKEFVSCGFENVRFWKIKNGNISGKMTVFQQPLKGKRFIGVGYMGGECEHVVAATGCGMIFKVKVSNRTVEQVIRGNEPFDSFKVLNASSNPLWMTVTGSTFRLWDGTRKQQLLEHSTEGQILCTSFNNAADKIALLDSCGAIGILKLRHKTYETLVRSHTDAIIDFAFSSSANSLVTVAKDATVRVWSLAELMQTAEFSVPQDSVTAVACSSTEPLCVCTFTSGFIRVFDLDKSEHYECPGTSAKLSEDLCAVCYSKDGLTLAVRDGRGKVMLLDAKERRYEVFRTMRIEGVNENYVDMEFSPGGDLFGCIGSNANVVCLWETMNYTLKYQLDLTGDIVSKIHFSPNAKDILVLTATSKLKYFRLDGDNKRCYQIMEVPGLHDLECTNLCVSNNCGFIITSGKDHNVKVFDYAMRGDLFPAFQSFAASQFVPSKLLLSPDNSQLVAVSRESCLVCVWESFVNSPAADVPNDIAGKELAAPSKDREEALVPASEAPRPLSMPRLWNAQESLSLPSKRWNLPPIVESPQEAQYDIPEAPLEELSLSNKNLKLEYVIGYNGAGCENVVWEKARWVMYTSTNKLLVELLENAAPDSRRQLVLSFGADKISSLAISANKKYIAAYTKQAVYTGNTSVYIIDTEHWKSISHIAIPHPCICSVSFSPNNNVLMVLSGTESESVLHFYDFVTPELLFHSALPGASVTAQWNQHSDTGLEFVVMSERKYDFWLLTPELSLQYQEGKHFLDSSLLTAFAFSPPVLALMGTMLILAKTHGVVNIVDTRTNSPIASVKLANDDIKLVQWKTKRLVFVTGSENVVYSVAVDTQDKNMTVAKMVEAMAKPESMLLDGVPVGMWFDEEGGEGMVGTAAGTVWLVDWLEHLSVKVCASHLSAAEAKVLLWKSYLTSAQGPPKRLLVSATSDQTIKVWDTETYEQQLKIAIPKEECLALAFHPFRQLCVCSFTDGYVRFFDLCSGSNMGRCMVSENDLVVGLAFFPNGTHILAASKAGILDLITIEKYETLLIKIATILNVRTSIASAKISSIEPYGKLLICTHAGKTNVMNRRKLTSSNYEAFTAGETPKYTLMDAFNLAEYEAAGFQEKSSADKNLTAYYGGQRKSKEGKEVLGDFSHTQSDTIICIEARNTNLYIRNYVLHQVIRKITLESPALTLDVCTSKMRVVVAMQNGKIRVQEYEGKEGVEYQTDSYNLFQGAVFCSHNMIASIAGFELAIYSIY